MAEWVAESLLSRSYLEWRFKPEDFREVRFSPVLQPHLKSNTRYGPLIKSIMAKAQLSQFVRHCIAPLGVSLAGVSCRTAAIIRIEWGPLVSPLDRRSLAGARRSSAGFWLQPSAFSLWPSASLSPGWILLEPVSQEPCLCLGMPETRFTD